MMFNEKLTQRRMYQQQGDHMKNIQNITNLKKMRPLYILE